MIFSLKKRIVFLVVVLVAGIPSLVSRDSLALDSKTISPIAQSLPSEQISDIAEGITVLIDGQNPGTGILVGKEGDRYQVLTAKHVVATEDEYEVVTPDNKRHLIDYSLVQKDPEVDLALVEFQSSETYEVATLGNSDQVRTGSSVYVSGFPGVLGGTLSFTPGQISGRAEPPLDDGYALIYTNTTAGGMSGGPVLNDDGEVVGIHGRADGEFILSADTGLYVPLKSGFNYGIPINRYSQQDLQSVSKEQPTTSTPTLIAKDPNQPKDQKTSRDSETLAPSPMPTSPVDPSPRLTPLPQGTPVLPVGRDPGRYYNQVFRLGTFTGHEGDVNSVAVSPDGQLIVSSSADRTIKIWNLSGDVLRDIRVIGAPSDAQITADGRYLLSNGGKVLDVYDLITGRWAFSLQGHVGAIRSLAVSEDSRYVATASLDGDVKLWDLETRELLRTLEGHPDWVLSVAFSRDGQQVYSGGGGQDNNILNVWDFNTGELLGTLTGHAGWITSLVMSPDGSFLVSGSPDNTVKVWDPVTGEVLKTFTGHQNWVTSVAVSPDSKTIASSSRDSTIRLWNAETGELIHTIETQPEKVKDGIPVLPKWVLSVRFSADGQTLVSSGEDNLVSIWLAVQP